MQLEGYDAHDFNLFDDRSSQFWRKPYVDGAVRKLTSGEGRSQEEIRQAVEQMMIAAGPGPSRPLHMKAPRAGGREASCSAGGSTPAASWSIRVNQRSR